MKKQTNGDKREKSKKYKHNRGQITGNYHIIWIPGSTTNNGDIEQEVVHRVEKFTNIYTKHWPGWYYSRIALPIALYASETVL